MAASVTLPDLALAPVLNASVADTQAVLRGLMNGLGYQTDNITVGTRHAIGWFGSVGNAPGVQAVRRGSSYVGH
ncbi:hypothetical protein AB4305_34265 [Nocardia sp. 2YAB30]|uniref:hypothetical protein n=1 Tax=Nocardia sp. 2YAB30 TaxID=3233022 RepID=UPI003F9632C1